jgi:nitrate/nitrite-specific signal transduction histidine kinase
MVLIMMGVAVVVIETISHLIEGTLNAVFFREVGLYLIVLPFLGFLVLRWMDRSENERYQAEQNLTQVITATRQLAGASDFTDLADQVLQLGRSILPAARIALFLHNANFDVYEMICSYQDKDQPASQDPTSLPASSIQINAGFHRLEELSLDNEDRSVEMWTCCLPLCIADQPVGLLQWELPAQVPTDPNAVLTLESIAPEIALALDRARLRLTTRSQAAIAEAERRHIAQDLHDTLGQNIAYLRLKLDELTLEGNPVLDIHEIHEELHRMQGIADEAYIQIRETLADLNPENIKEFSLALLELSRQVANRARLSIEFNQTGTPIPLQPHVKRQLLFICRETMNNIEKHAGAEYVQINLEWIGQALSVRFQDNGKGFIPGEVDRENHFGLNIMQERSQSISATMKVESNPGKGTVVTIIVPLYTGGIPASRSATEDITLPVFSQR